MSSKHPSVGDLPPDPLEKRPVRDRVEVAFEIGVHHPYPSFLEELVHPPECSLAPAPRSKPVALWRKVALKDRLDHVT